MKYILAADDEPVNRLIIDEALVDDYEIKCVEDGQSCLHSIAERVPDLLLLDVAMPGIDGIEVCQKLRADEKTRDLPIIMLSGFASKEHVEKGMDVGADNYITKPFEPTELRDAIKSMIGN